MVEGMNVLTYSYYDSTIYYSDSFGSYGFSITVIVPHRPTLLGRFFQEIGIFFAYILFLIPTVSVIFSRSEYCYLKMTYKYYIHDSLYTYGMQVLIRCYHQCCQCGVIYECKNNYCAKPFQHGKCTLCYPRVI